MKLQLIFWIFIIAILQNCASLGLNGISNQEVIFESPNIRIEKFPETFNLKGKGQVRCKSNPCSSEETSSANFKSLLKHGAWEEYIEKQDPNDPKKKYSVLSKAGNYDQGKRVGDWEEYVEKVDTKTNKNYVVVDRKGKYVNGEKEGIWEYYYDVGAGIVGPLFKKANFKAGLKQGLEQKFNKTGTIIEEANYVDDLLDGKFINKTQTGLLEQEGQFSKDKKTGQWKEYYAENKDMVLKIINHYKEDKKDGPETRFYPDGSTKMVEGNFTNGLETGPWKYYYNNGKLESEGNYQPVEDTPDPNAKDEDGSVKTTKDNLAKPKAKKIGLWKRYYKSGDLFFEGNREGKPVGEWKFYHKDGKLAAKGFMANDFMMKEGEFYDKAGNLEGKGKVMNSLIKLDEKTDSIEIKYSASSPFTYYKNGKKYLEVTSETSGGYSKAIMFDEAGNKIGEGGIEPLTRKKNGCWTMNGKKTYFLMDKENTGPLAKMNKCE